MAFLLLMMQYAERYIQTAGKIITNYDGAVPLHHHLKQFFAADKKYGSKDRKAITHACYCFFRIGSALKELQTIERIRIGIYLCSDDITSWKEVFPAEWIERWSTQLQDRIQFIAEIYPFVIEEIFPLTRKLSDGISSFDLAASHLIQPDLHLRIRPGKKERVFNQLTKANITFQTCGDNCIALPNATKIDSLLQLNKDVVVQDLSSQRIAEFLSLTNHQTPNFKLQTSNPQPQTPNFKPPTSNLKLQTPSVWDCCAASGGKSILAVDVLKNIELTVSDVRPSIIQNLKKRFAEAGIKNYTSFVCDLTANCQLPTANCDLIICDAPCSGSGTWSRTPEQLSFFNEEKISYYSNLQKQIVKNIIPAVAHHGYLLYITCSVFKEENEGIVEFIQSNSDLQLVKMELLKGYDKKADTMFAALFSSLRGTKQSPDE